jgi:hypothetical protein
MMAMMALSGLSLSAAASAGSAPPRLYAAAATKTCLTSLPNAVVGLPPATPPAPTALFIYSFPPQHVPPSVHERLGAWYGEPGKVYTGVILSFFKTAQGARRSFSSVLGPWGGKLSGNVVVSWDLSSVPRGSLRTTVLGCLRVNAAADGTRGSKQSTPRASLATFAGHWGGHTRGLNITARGRGAEGASAGCCDRQYEMTFQILSVSGTLTRATATYRVTSFKSYDRYVPRLRTGRIGKFLLTNGIVTNTLTNDYFCSNPAWGATGACGA